MDFSSPSYLPSFFVFHNSAVTASSADLETMNIFIMVSMTSIIVFRVDSFIRLTMAGKGIIVAEVQTLACHLALLRF